MNHFEKEVTYLKEYLKDTFAQINLLNFNLSTTENMLIKFDRDQINKQRVNMKASIDQMNDIIEKVLLVVYL